MSDISAVYTQITKSSSGNAPGMGNIAANGKSDSINFFDLISQLTSSKLAAATIATDAAAATDAATVTTATDETAAATDEATTTDGTTALAFDLSGTGTTTTLDAEGLKTLKAALDNLLHGLPADQKPVAIKLTGAQLQKIMQDIKTGAIQAQDSQPTLIATGLTPEQLTKLSDMIAQGNVGEAVAGNTDSSADDGLKAILVGILKLVPDEDNGKAEIFLPKTLMVAKDEKSVKLSDKDKDEGDTLVASLSALIGNSTPQLPPPAPVATGPMDTSGVKEGGLDSGALAPEKNGGFGDVLKLLEQIQTKTAPGTDTLTGQQAKADAAPQAGAMNSTTGMSFSDIFGGLSSDGSLDGMFPDGLDWSKSNQYGLSNVQASGPAQLTSLVTQASATAAHPATQVVAATLARTFEGGETKHLTLRLDPPELGKIEIQMQFTKDKSVKTHMVFEKPETMLMMQRDSRTLELAMQNAGMDAGGNTLSFELGSQNNNAFTHGQGGNNGSNGSGRSADNSEPQLIETTMSWSVDADTGMKHYNALV